MKKGFTLIELLVVVLIIGVLSAVALPQYQKAVLKSRTAEAWVNLKNLKMAAEAYCLENPNDYVWFKQDKDSSSAWASSRNLSINLSRSKNFTYEIPPHTFCYTVNSGGLAYGATATYEEGSKRFTLGLNSHGYRSCEGNACTDIGFSKEGASSQGYCVCGTGSFSCYYMD